MSIRTRATTAVARVVNSQSAPAIVEALHLNPWAQPSRMHPNAEKLLDGAVQRKSVSATSDELAYVSQNINGVGSYKRAEHNTKTSSREIHWTNPWDGQLGRHKICRIYMPQKKHLHCHPTNKQYGMHWAVDFPSDGSFKSSLMGWTRASEDPYTFMSTPY